MERALELYPTSANIMEDLGQIYYFSRDFEKAEEFYRKAAALDETFGRRRLLVLFQKQGRDKDAFELTLSLDCKGHNANDETKCIEEFESIFHREGARGLALKELYVSQKLLADKKTSVDLISASWYGSAISYIKLGEKDNALTNLKKSFQTKPRYGIMNFTFPFLGVDPQFVELRSDPRLHEILIKLKLE